MVEITAAKVLARFRYESTDFDPDSDETTSYTNVEHIIDDTIDFVNAEAGTSISSMAGTDGEKTVTVTNSQNAVIKLILSFALRDAKYKVNEGTGLGPASVSESMYSMDATFRKMLWMSMNRLRGRSFVRT